VWDTVGAFQIVLCFGELTMILFLAFGLMALFGFVFWLWMLIDCAVNESDQGNTKIVWIIIIVFTNLVGAVVYFLVQRPKRDYAGALSTHSKSGPL
jgi:hypothetical protein